MTYSNEIRSAVVATLQQLNSDLGYVPNSAIENLSREIKVAKSTIRRWFSATQAPAVPVNLEKLDEEHIEVVFKHMGNLSKAKKELDSRYPATFKSMSYATFRRRWLSLDQTIREMAEGGATALIRVQPKMLYQAEAPNQLWHIDHQELPIWVLPRGYRTNPVKPWCTTIEDDRTRRIMSVLLTVVAPNAESTMVALADAMLLRPSSAEGVFMGGVPATVQRWRIQVHRIRPVPRSPGSHPQTDLPLSETPERES